MNRFFVRWTRAHRAREVFINITLILVQYIYFALIKTEPDHSASKITAQNFYVFPQDRNSPSFSTPHTEAPVLCRQDIVFLGFVLKQHGKKKIAEGVTANTSTRTIKMKTNLINSVSPMLPSSLSVPGTYLEGSFPTPRGSARGVPRSQGEARLGGLSCCDLNTVWSLCSAIKSAPSMPVHVSLPFTL